MSIGVYNDLLNNAEVVILPLYMDNSDTKTAIYGGSSNMNNQLSQERIIMDDKVDDASTSSKRYYKEALIFFEEMVYSCSNDV